MYFCSRFLPLAEGTYTDGVLAVDDDMRISCHDLALAHETWRNSPDTLVGWMPRTHMRGSEGGLLYRCWWSVWWSGSYSIVLTKVPRYNHSHQCLPHICQ